MFKPSDIVVAADAPEDLLLPEEVVQIDRALRGRGRVPGDEHLPDKPWTQSDIREGRYIGGFPYHRTTDVEAALGAMGWELIPLDSEAMDGRVYYNARPKAD